MAAEITAGTRKLSGQCCLHSVGLAACRETWWKVKGAGREIIASQPCHGLGEHRTCLTCVVAIHSAGHYVNLCSDLPCRASEIQFSLALLQLSLALEKLYVL